MDQPKIVYDAAVKPVGAVYARRGTVRIIVLDPDLSPAQQAALIKELS